MSTELHVFLPGQTLPAKAAWQAVLDRLHVPLDLGPGPETPEISGFYPMILRGKRVGVEAYIDDPHDFTKVYPEVDQVATEVRSVISFRWSAYPKEAACAFGASSALVEGFNATVFFPDGNLISRNVAEIIREMNLFYSID